MGHLLPSKMLNKTGPCTKEEDGLQVFAQQQSFDFIASSFAFHALLFVHNKYVIWGNSWCLLGRLTFAINLFRVSSRGLTYPCWPHLLVKQTICFLVFFHAFIGGRNKFHLL
jgi:hypothetical protein